VHACQGRRACLSRRIQRLRKALIIAGSIAATVLAAGALMMGSVLSAPALRSVGDAPSDLNAADVSFDGVKGWFVAADNDAPCVLLMHGVRADRRSMIQRARVLREAGYSSLLIDLQAHGESPGRHITFGHLESANARAAVLVLREQFHCQKVAAIGQSLGGAAALLGKQPLAVDALVLESVYPTIKEAVADRLRIRLGGPGTLLTPILLMQLKPRLGVSADELQPIRYIGDFHGPLLIVGGENDEHTTLEETRRLYAAANEPKQLWIVPGAAHVDLQRLAPAAYSQHVLAFLKAHVPTTDTAPGSDRPTAQ
jgi:fermentation-respiration switch protein FrsA (DUF1100 family)